MEEAEFEIQSAIVIRQGYLERLKNYATKIDSESVSRYIQKCADVMLLLRQVTLDLVEWIERWRQYLDGKPRPYEYEKVNYLQEICQDTSFLDKNFAIRNAVGFSLERNPFFLTENLDTIISLRLGIAIDLPPRPLSSSALDIDNLSLILLVSDPETMSRLENAMNILCFEECLHGRRKLGPTIETIMGRVETSAAVRQRLKPVRLESNYKRTSIFDECQAMSNEFTKVQRSVYQLKRTVEEFQNALSNLQREIAWIEFDKTISTDEFSTFIAICKRNQLKHCHSERLEITTALETAMNELRSSQEFMLTTQSRLERLMRDKKLVQEDYKHRKQSRAALKVQAEQIEANQLKTSRENARKAAQRQAKSAEKIRREVKLKQKKPDEERLQVLKTPELSAAELQRRQLVRQKMEKERLEKDLQQKRIENQQKRQDDRRVALEQKQELDRRRTEAALMLREDKASRRVREKIKRHHELRTGLETWESEKNAPVFTSTQRISGKLYRLSIRRVRARGYVPDGYQVHIVNPLDASSFEFSIAERSYQANGYNDTVDSFQYWCDGLCIVYNKQKRTFDLKWNGRPYPVPLRRSRHDMSMITLQKIGLHVAGRYYLVHSVVREHRDVISIAYSDMIQSHEVSMSLRQELAYRLAWNEDGQLDWWFSQEQIVLEAQTTLDNPQGYHRTFLGSYGIRVGYDRCLLKVYSVQHKFLYRKSLLLIQVFRLVDSSRREFYLPAACLFHTVVADLSYYAVDASNGS